MQYVKRERARENKCRFPTLNTQDSTVITGTKYRQIANIAINTHRICRAEVKVVAEVCMRECKRKRERESPDADADNDDGDSDSNGDGVDARQVKRYLIRMVKAKAQPDGPDGQTRTERRRLSSVCVCKQQQQRQVPVAAAERKMQKEIKAGVWCRGRGSSRSRRDGQSILRNENAVFGKRCSCCCCWHNCAMAARARARARAEPSQAEIQRRRQRSSQSRSRSYT